MNYKVQYFNGQTSSPFRNQDLIKVNTFNGVRIHLYSRCLKWGVGVGVGGYQS